MATTAACTARTTHPLVMCCPQRAGQRLSQQQAPRNEQSKSSHGGCMGAPQSGKGAQHARKVCGAGGRAGSVVENGTLFCTGWVACAKCPTKRFKLGQHAANQALMKTGAESQAQRPHLPNKTPAAALATCMPAKRQKAACTCPALTQARAAPPHILLPSPVAAAGALPVIAVEGIVVWVVAAPRSAARCAIAAAVAASVSAVRASAVGARPGLRPAAVGACRGWQVIAARLGI